MTTVCELAKISFVLNRLKREKKGEEGGERREEKTGEKKGEERGEEMRWRREENEHFGILSIFFCLPNCLFFF